MVRFGFMIILFFALFSCSNKKTGNKKTDEEKDSLSFVDKFRSLKVPYQLTDTLLLNNNDTTKIATEAIKPYIPDSINEIFGKGNRVKYIAMGKIVVPKAETYYLVKATGGSRKAALLLTFNNDKQFGATLPFLVPDDNAATTQTSSIDKNYTITRNVTSKLKNDVMKDGKDVYVYNKDAGQFTLIMTDLLDESKAELINPIDTFPRQNKFAGDYIKDKKNLVSVRDGKRPNELRVFTHFEKEEGDCTGELRGDALFVSSNKAVYRQGGDPCVLEFSFTPSSVTLREQEGCGSHRGVKCVFDGSYPKKKEIKPKAVTKKSLIKKK